MIHGLSQLSWERVDVSFHNSKQRYVAHSTIQASLIIGTWNSKAILLRAFDIMFFVMCRWKHIGYILMAKMLSSTWWIISVSSPKHFQPLQFSQHCKKAIPITNFFSSSFLVIYIVFSTMLDAIQIVGKFLPLFPWWLYKMFYNSVELWFCTGLLVLCKKKTSFSCHYRFCKFLFWS